MKKIFTLLLITFFATLSANNSKLDNDKIVACPTATISYPSSPFCTSTCSATVFLTGTDTYTGGTFSSTAGLAINAATGEINPCVSVPGTYTVSYTIPAGAGCPGFLTTTTVTILGDDQITPTSAFMNQTVCVNQSIINITAATTYATGASATGLPPGVTSTWSSNIITISGTPTVPGTYNYTIYTTGGNCFPAANYSGTITVLPYPGASVNSPSVCSGSAATVTATPSAAGTYSYSWTVPAGATNPGNVASFSTTIAGTYSVILNNTGTGCSGTSTSGTVTINPSPTVTVNSPSVCSGSNATVTATPGATGSYTYTWTVPSGATNPGNVASFSTSIAGTYSVIATKNGCASASASGIVTVNPPAGAFNLQCNAISATQTYFDWSNIVGITNFNYSYSINGGPIITGSQSAPSSIYITNNNQPVTFTLSGTGTVCAPTETITCGALSTDENNINDFVISPNPVTDILNIKNNQTINKVTAFNQLGQIVLQRAYNNNEVQLDFSGLKTGIYFISVDSDTKQSTFKIVKN